MPINARVRRFFRVPRDRAIPALRIIGLELLLLGLPIALFAILRIEGPMAPLWLLTVTAVLCYVVGLGAAALLVAGFKRRLDRGVKAAAPPVAHSTKESLAMLGAAGGAIGATWLSTRAAGSPAMVLVGLLLLLSAGLIRGVMILDQPKPGHREGPPQSNARSA